MRSKRKNGDEELRELEREYLASYPRTSEQLEGAIKQAYMRRGVENWKDKFSALEDKARLSRPLEEGQEKPETQFWVVRITGGREVKPGALRSVPYPAKQPRVSGKAPDLETTVYQSEHDIQNMTRFRGRSQGPQDAVWRAIKKLGRKAERPGGFVWVWSSRLIDTMGEPRKTEPHASFDRDRIAELGRVRRQVRPRKGQLPHWSFRMTKAGYSTYKQIQGGPYLLDHEPDLVWLSPYEPKTTKAVFNPDEDIRDLERRAAEGDPSALRRLRIERRRRGMPSGVTWKGAKEIMRTARGLRGSMSERAPAEGWTNERYRIRVFETFHDYEIEDLDTGVARGMGDGVDMFSDPSDRGGLAPGTAAFNEAMAREVANNGAELREAYFGGDERSEENEEDSE